MKNIFLKRTIPAAVTCGIGLAGLFSAVSCSRFETDRIPEASGRNAAVTAVGVVPENVALLLAAMPMDLDQVREVWAAVTASSENGYDEEYPFRNLLQAPGSGVGADVLAAQGIPDPAGTRALLPGAEPLRDRLAAAAGACLAEEASETRSDMRRWDGFSSVQALLDALERSGLQVYWPYSEDWDGRTMPVVTFLPDRAWSPRTDGDVSNTAYAGRRKEDGSWEVTRMTVNEETARRRPVWVVNYNEDGAFLTPQLLGRLRPEPAATRGASDNKTLRLKEFKAHVHYDSWLSGGSEFFVKCGSLKAFTATVASDLTQYTPEITDLMIKVKRKQVLTTLRYNTILVPEWSPQLTECVFLIHEDDGGKITTWKASGEVKIKSKSYGFAVEFPYHRNDDIVWRGKLSSTYFEKNNGLPNRYGDVSITFTFN